MFSEHGHKCNDVSLVEVVAQAEQERVNSIHVNCYWVPIRQGQKARLKCAEENCNVIQSICFKVLTLKLTASS